MPRHPPSTLNRIFSLTKQLPSLPSTTTRTMATSSTIRLTPSTPGIFHVPLPQITPESYTLTSKLLQQNHDNNHMYFNPSGFHNHIAHHLLTLFSLGATPTQIQNSFTNNNSYQRPQFPITPHNVQSMSDPAQFTKFLNNEKYFHDYEAFFRDEIEREGGDWGAVLRTHLLADTEHARTLLARVFAGFYHPIIHLGFGVEFRQPPIIIEALAQAATHDEWPRKFLEGTTERAKTQRESKTLVELLREARASEKIRGSPHWDDGNKVRDGVFKRALDEVVELCSQWRVKPEKGDIERKTAEMINACALFSGASQHASREKEVKFDFFHMHCMNASVFFSAFLREENDGWLGMEGRAKLLMWKGWSDVAMYISRGSAELFVDEITSYVPRVESGWDGVFARVDAMEHDDGHASKLVRALANGEKVCRPFEGDAGEDEFVVRGDMWLKLGHMAIDSVEHAESKWVRNVGFEQAWKDVGKRSGRKVTNGVRGNGTESYDEK